MLGNFEGSLKIWIFVVKGIIELEVVRTNHQFVIQLKQYRIAVFFIVPCTIGIHHIHYGKLNFAGNAPSSFDWWEMHKLRDTTWKHIHIINILFIFLSLWFCSRQIVELAGQKFHSSVIVQNCFLFVVIATVLLIRPHGIARIFGFGSYIWKMLKWIWTSLVLRGWWDIFTRFDFKLKGNSRIWIKLSIFICCEILICVMNDETMRSEMNLQIQQR